MRIQSQIIIAILCINAAIAFVDTLGYLEVIPGWGYAHGLSEGANVDYEGSMVEYGNATDIATQWSQNPPSVIAVVGDIVGSLPSYFKIIVDIIGGFPLLIIQLGSMFALNDVAVLVIAAVATLLATPFGFLMFSYIIELISGRQMNE